MSPDKGEIVLVTGGSGFIGQHIIKHLIEQQDTLDIYEIRSLDLIPYKNKIGHKQTNDLKIFIGDICNPKAIEGYFQNVSCVFHCASLISMEYPPNHEELDRVNVVGTKNIVELCIKYNVNRLIYTSCASVCMVPFKGHSTFAIIINQTESKAITPNYDTSKAEEFDKQFLIPGYSSSKLKAEEIVLNSNNAQLSNATDYLKTVAIRHPLTYGECDERFIPNIFHYLSRHNFVYPRLAGAGGKQQIVYAGNVAWGHICAYKTMKTTPKAIAGLPVFVTDDTPINDVCRFVQKIAIQGQLFKINLTKWYLPHFLFYFLAFLTEFFLKLMYPIMKKKLQFSLRAISSFTASVLMFNRLRASIHMDYVPLYETDDAVSKSTIYYIRHLQEMKPNLKIKSR